PRDETRGRKESGHEPPRRRTQNSIHSRSTPTTCCARPRPPQVRRLGGSTRLVTECPRQSLSAGRTSAPCPFVTQLRTSAHAISEGQSPDIWATTDMLECYAISFPNVTS